MWKSTDKAGPVQNESSVTQSRLTGLGTARTG